MNHRIPRKLIIHDQKIKEKVLNIREQLRNPSPRNQSKKRELALSRVDLFIHNMRQLSTQSESYLETFFDQTEDNFYYLKKDYFKKLGVKKMVIEDKDDYIYLRKLEIDL